MEAVDAQSGAPPSAPVSLPGTGQRYAEKSRVSTCEFADVVARRSIAQWRSLREKATNLGDANQEPTEHTVLATFVAVVGATDETKSLHVVALGVGTKFMRKADIESDEEGRKVHDCHAEVLARRALLKMLWKEIESRLDESKETPALRLLELSPEKKGRFRLRQDVSLHLYSSSTPCGNSAVRRWASGISEKRMESYDEKPLEWPNLTHTTLDLCMRFQGQIAASVKRDADESQLGTTNGNSDSEVPPAMVLPQPGHNIDPNVEVREKQTKKRRKKHVESPFAIGTDDTDPKLGRVLSCSDKIAIWNALGVQGAVMSNFVDPIYLSTIIVGRKFARRHLARAMCCRLQELPLVAPFRLNHPVLLCTGVKLADGIVAQDAKAQFTNTICASWCLLDASAELLNGDQGVPYGADEQCSAIAPSTLRGLAVGLMDQVDHPTAAKSDLVRLGDRSKVYSISKANLLTLLKSREKPKFALRVKPNKPVDSGATRLIKSSSRHLQQTTK